VARVANFKGQLSTPEMLTVFASARKAQNYYHYLAMTNCAYFDKLSVGTQRKLMQRKTQICFSLNVAVYFFGHQATTAVQQDMETGLDTGMGDFLRAHHPDLIDTLPPVAYDDIFIVPWATSRHVEKKHRDLLESVGKTLKGLDFNGYLLLYGICLYTLDAATLAAMDVPLHDAETLQNAQSYFTVMYRRFLKHMVGWKRAMDLRLNQRHMLDQLQQAVHITSVDNLHCNDLSDMTNLDANAGHSGLKQSITFTE